MTYVLLYVLGVGAVITSVPTVGLISIILAIGVATILLYDELGGGNGVFFFTHTGIFPWHLILHCKSPLYKITLDDP